jgi:hypothetical protein
MATSAHNSPRHCGASQPTSFWALRTEEVGHWFSDREQAGANAWARHRCRTARGFRGSTFSSKMHCMFQILTLESARGISTREWKRPARLQRERTPVARATALCVLASQVVAGTEQAARRSVSAPWLGKIRREFATGGLISRMMQRGWDRTSAARGEAVFVWAHMYRVHGRVFM